MRCQFCHQDTGHHCPEMAAAMEGMRGKRKSRKGNPRVLEALAKARAAKCKKGASIGESGD